MSLRAWQTGLAALVGATPHHRRPILAPSAADLESQERDHLVRIAGSRGLEFTASVQRSWCELRATRAAHFTLGVLPPAEGRALVESWVGRGGGTASFFATEAEAFLEFIAGTLPVPSHVLSVCRFEQATHRA